MIRIEVSGPDCLWVAINVEKNTRIIKVLDEVCLRKKLGSSDDYDLKHGKKILDLSFTVEMAMLHNSVKLELIKSCKPRHNSIVSIVIQLSETNARLDVKTFKAETSFYEILKSYEVDCKLNLLQHSQNNYHPVIQYLKDEFIGIYALQNCTLKDLGLFSGRVSLRYKFREVEELTLQNIASAINKGKKMIENIISRNKNNLIVDSNSNTPLPDHPGTSLEIASNYPTQLDYYDTAILEKQTIESESMDLFEQPHPEEDEVKSDASLQSGNFSSSKHSNLQDVEMEDSVIYNLVPNNSFNDFKFPEETRGKNIYENHLSNRSSEDIESCDRNLHVFKVEDSKVLPEMINAQVPDEFFDHTVNDLKIIYRDLKQNLERLNEEPLMTHKLRSADSERRLAKYRLTVVRVHFQDGYIVQANFKPLENGFQVYKFINGLIEEKHADFELYTSPPRITLDKSQTLFNANLVPLSLVYFSGPRPSTGLYLSEETRSRISSKEEADLASVNCIGLNEQTIESSIVANKSEAKPRNITENTATPKWFLGAAKKKKVPTATLR